MKCMMAPPVCGFVMSSACVGLAGNLMGTPTYAGQAGTFAVMDPPATWVICSAVHPGLCLSSAYIVMQPVEPSVETAVVSWGSRGVLILIMIHSMAAGWGKPLTRGRRARAQRARRSSSLGARTAPR